MPKILLVEDDPDTRELVRLTLELGGNEVLRPAPPRRESPRRSPARPTSSSWT